jgi:hypothetical protein
VGLHPKGVIDAKIRLRVSAIGEEYRADLISILGVVKKPLQSFKVLFYNHLCRQSLLRYHILLSGEKSFAGLHFRL